jgi:hypothetical protein
MTCVPGCNTTPDCPTPYVCNAGECVECIGDTDCSGLGPGWTCDTRTHACVACTSDMQCAGVMPGTGKCGGLECDGCTTDADCKVFGNAQQAKCTQRHTCGACTSNADCAGTIPGGCDLTQGACNGCVTDQDCCIVTNVTPCPLHCDPTIGHCECRTATECAQWDPDGGVKQWGCFPQ